MSGAESQNGSCMEADRRTDLGAGTENVAGIAGLATAARIAYETLSDRARQERKSATI